MRIAIAAAVSFALCSQGVAQQATPQKIITFAVTLDQAGTILNQVGELKWKDANPLMQSLITQANEQTKAPPAAAIPTPAPNLPPVGAPEFPEE